MEHAETRAELNLQSLYRDYLPAVYRVAYSCMHNAFDSEDAAQEAFLRLAKFRGSFEDARQIKAWLIVTVTNICRDMLRRRSRQDANIEDYQQLAAPLLRETRCWTPSAPCPTSIGPWCTSTTTRATPSGRSPRRCTSRRAP